VAQRNLLGIAPPLRADTLRPAADTAAACFATNLDAMEFVLPGHLVADIVIADRVDSPSCSTFTVEALTVEDV